MHHNLSHVNFAVVSSDPAWLSAREQLWNQLELGQNQAVLQTIQLETSVCWLHAGARLI
jgi:hypothetical protein